MNRVFKILAAFLFGTCLIGVALACTVLRPRSEVFPPTIAGGFVENGIPMRESVRVARYWYLYPLREWKLGVLPGNSLTYGWQCGPFAFKEVHRHSRWPVAVEKAARAVADKELNQSESELMIFENDSSPRSWHVTIFGPGGKELDMNFDDQGKPLEIPDTIPFELQVKPPVPSTYAVQPPRDGRTSIDFLEL